MPFCPKCGVDIPPGRSFCDEHRPFSLEVKPFAIRLCACGRFFSHNHWFFPDDLEASVLKVVREHVKQSVELSLGLFEAPQKRKGKGHGRAVAVFEGESFPIDFDVRLEQCDKCSKIGTHFFTAKLQLRNPPPAVLPFVEDFLRPLAEKGVAVNKVEDSPNGLDLFLTHKSAARQLGERLVRRFGGVFSQSEQLFSRNKQTSKDLFRLNVKVEFPSFSVGDAVLLGSRAVLVTGLGKQCTGRDLARDKKVVFAAGEEDEVLKVFSTTVATVHPQLTVLDPETFQSVPVGNAVVAEPGQEVRVVRADHRWFVL